MGYPHRPPAIYMITPSGRFEVNKRICMSMSDYHPESWNPTWSVATIILGLQSFMLEETPSAGCVRASDSERRRLACESRKFNSANPVYRKIFDLGEVSDDVEKLCKKAQISLGLDPDADHAQTNDAGG